MEGTVDRGEVFAAVERDDASVLIPLASQCGLLTSLTKDEETLLHKACRAKATSVVKLLVSHDVGSVLINAHGCNGDTPLHIACYNHDITTLLLLLSVDGCGCNSPDHYGRSVLEVACDTSVGAWDCALLLYHHLLDMSVSNEQTEPPPSLPVPRLFYTALGHVTQWKEKHRTACNTQKHYHLLCEKGETHLLEEESQRRLFLASRATLIYHSQEYGDVIRAFGGFSLSLTNALAASLSLSDLPSPKPFDLRIHITGRGAHEISNVSHVDNRECVDVLFINSMTSCCSAACWLQMDGDHLLSVPDHLLCEALPSHSIRSLVVEYNIAPSCWLTRSNVVESFAVSLLSRLRKKVPDIGTHRLLIFAEGLGVSIAHQLILLLSSLSHSETTRTHSSLSFIDSEFLQRLFCSIHSLHTFDALVPSSSSASDCVTVAERLSVLARCDWNHSAFLAAPSEICFASLSQSSTSPVSHFESPHVLSWTEALYKNAISLVCAANTLQHISPNLTHQPSSSLSYLDVCLQSITSLTSTQLSFCVSPSPQPHARSGDHFYLVISLSDGCFSATSWTPPTKELEQKGLEVHQLCERKSYRSLFEAIATSIDTCKRYPILFRSPKGVPQTIIVESCDSHVLVLSRTFILFLFKHRGVAVPIIELSLCSSFPSTPLVNNIERMVTGTYSSDFFSLRDLERQYESLLQQSLSDSTDQPRSHFRCTSVNSAVAVDPRKRTKVVVSPARSEDNIGESFEEATLSVEEASQSQLGDGDSSLFNRRAVRVALVGDTYSEKTSFLTTFLGNPLLEVAQGLSTTFVIKHTCASLYKQACARLCANQPPRHEEREESAACATVNDLESDDEFGEEGDFTNSTNTDLREDDIYNSVDLNETTTNGERANEMCNDERKDEAVDADCLWIEVVLVSTKEYENIRAQHETSLSDMEERLAKSLKQRSEHLGMDSELQQRMFVERMILKKMDEHYCNASLAGDCLLLTKKDQCMDFLTRFASRKSHETSSSVSMSDDIPSLLLSLPLELVDEVTVHDTSSLLKQWTVIITPPLRMQSNEADKRLKHALAYADVWLYLLSSAKHIDSYHLHSTMMKLKEDGGLNGMILLSDIDAVEDVQSGEQSLSDWHTSLKEQISYFTVTQQTTLPMYSSRLCSSFEGEFALSIASASLPLPEPKIGRRLSRQQAFINDVDQLIMLSLEHSDVQAFKSMDFSPTRSRRKAHIPFIAFVIQEIKDVEERIKVIALALREAGLIAPMMRDVCNFIDSNVLLVNLHRWSSWLYSNLSNHMWEIRNDIRELQQSVTALGDSSSMNSLLSSFQTQKLLAALRINEFRDAEESARQLWDQFMKEVETLIDHSCTTRLLDDHSFKHVLNQALGQHLWPFGEKWINVYDHFDRPINEHVKQVMCEQLLSGDLHETLLGYPFTAAIVGIDNRSMCVALAFYISRYLSLLSPPHLQNCPSILRHTHSISSARDSPIRSMSHSKSSLDLSHVFHVSDDSSGGKERSKIGNVLARARSTPSSRLTPPSSSESNDNRDLVDHMVMYRRQFFSVSAQLQLHGNQKATETFLVALSESAARHRDIMKQNCREHLSRAFSVVIKPLIEDLMEWAHMIAERYTVRCVNYKGDIEKFTRQDLERDVISQHLRMKAARIKDEIKHKQDLIDRALSLTLLSFSLLLKHTAHLRFD